MNRSTRDLEQENERLRTRLAEAEQTLDAIRKGEVDSFVVEGPQGCRVYALEAVTNAYRVLLESMSEGAATLSKTGIILYGNSQFARLLGRPLPQIMGASLASFVPDDFNGLVQALIRGDGSHGETVLLAAGGVAVPVYLSTQVDHGDRNVVCMVAVDLRPQKHNQALQETAAQLRSLVENLPDLAWTALPDGHVDFYNRRWYEYTGTTLEQMQGWGWQRAHDPTVLPEVLGRWKTSLGTGEPFEMEFPLCGHDGVFRTFLTRIVPFRDADGRVVRWFGTSTNVDELKKLRVELAELTERERAARVAAEEANHAKDDFLAMLGHELRNPLAPILTAVHLLRIRCKENLSREVSVIERQSQHIARLVDDLLDVSRIARGKVVLNKDSVEVAELVTAAIETASPVIERGHHALVLKVPKQGLVVDVDRVRMTQVLSNLLTNAAKYTPAGGRISVMATREGDDVVIAVEDTGTGISSELLPRVFDLFVQSRQTLDRAQGGLGLGLSIVKNLVAMHGASVAAQSEGVGRGSTFTVRLPAPQASAAQVEPSSPQATAIEPHQPRVLVVDDNADGADMLSATLEGLGYRTVTAYDGPDALRVAGSFVPHIALLDLGLPVMDGYELAARLREQWRDVKLVAITGYGQEGDLERTRRAGFQAHLTKPVDLEKLAKLLAKLSGGAEGTATRAN
jgi:PAS domain S-box-containing protein